MNSKNEKQWGGNMKKVILKSMFAALAGVGLMASGAMAGPVYTIEFEQDSTDVLTLGNAAFVGVNQIDDGSGTSQPSAIYGAGFMMDGPGVNFNVDLFTWDSYSMPNQEVSGGTGWFDAFVLNLSQVGYYWQTIGPNDDPITDPTYAGGTPTTTNKPNGISWVWGGTSYGNALETFETDITTFQTLMLPGYDPTLPVFVSVVLDTKTLPYADINYASWGKFDVEAVPEPATMLLFGVGLAGLAGTRRRMKK